MSTTKNTTVFNYESPYTKWAQLRWIMQLPTKYVKNIDFKDLIKTNYIAQNQDSCPRMAAQLV